MDRSRVLRAYQKYAFLSAMTDRLAAARNYSSQAEAQRLIAAAMSFRERECVSNFVWLVLFQGPDLPSRATAAAERNRRVGCRQGGGAAAADHAGQPAASDDARDPQRGGDVPVHQGQACQLPPRDAPSPENT